MINDILENIPGLKKFVDILDDHGVSPIVATLVLIVVAIIGAAAIGLLMGSFSSGVSKQANTGDISGQSSITLYLADSDIMKPVDQLLASQYNANHTGAHVVVETGSGDAGVIATGTNVADIGGVSHQLTADETAKYPNLVSGMIGGRAIVIIAHNDLNGLITTGVSAAEFQTVFSQDKKSLNSNLHGVTKAVRDVDGQGSDDIFANWVTNGAASSLDQFQVAPDGVTIVNLNSEQAVLSYVSSTPGAIGYVDWNLVSDNNPSVSNFNVIPVIDTANGMLQTPSASTITAEINDMDNASYDAGLVRQLYYVYDDPETMVSDYLSFVMSSNVASSFDQEGLLSIYDLGQATSASTSVTPYQAMLKDVSVTVSGNSIVAPTGTDLSSMLTGGHLTEPAGAGSMTVGISTTSGSNTGTLTNVQVNDASTGTVNGAPASVDANADLTGLPSGTVTFSTTVGDATQQQIDDANNWLTSNGKSSIQGTPLAVIDVQKGGFTNANIVAGTAIITVTINKPADFNPSAAYEVIRHSDTGYQELAATVESVTDTTVTFVIDSPQGFSEYIFYDQEHVGTLVNIIWPIPNQQASGMYYIANSTYNVVMAVNLDTNTVVATIPVGLQPAWWTRSGPNSNVYIANHGSNTVSVIDVTTNTVVATIPVGIGPQGVWASPDGTKIYVTNCGSNTLSVIDTSTNNVIETVPVGNGPFGIWVTNPTTAYITNRGDNTVSIIDLTSLTVTATIPVGKQPFGVAVTQDGTKAYVSNTRGNTVSVIDLTTNKVISTIPVGNGPSVVALSSDGTTIYVTNNNDNTYSVIDIATDTVTSTIPA